MIEYFWIVRKDETFLCKRQNDITYVLFYDEDEVPTNFWISGMFPISPEIDEAISFEEVVERLKDEPEMLLAVLEDV